MRATAITSWTSFVTVGGDALLDTGPLVALLNARDDEHERCEAFFRNFRGRLLTTEPVLTEAVYLLAGIRGGAASCLEFFARGGAVLVPQSPASLLRCKALIEKYADVPMDFADATLVTLADETHIGRIFTLDRRGFGVYRYRRDRTFSLLP